jgi:hypothetical protein
MDRKLGVLLGVGMLASCVASPVSQIGNDTYAIPLQPRPLTSLRTIQDRAAEAADRYCEALGRDAHINEADAVRLVFTCVARVTFEDRMNTAVRAFLGKNVRLAVTRLGYPTSREVLGDTVYEWHEDRYDSVKRPIVSGTWGDVDGKFFSGSTSSSEYVPVQAACSIQLAAAADGVVRGVHWSGNERGCASYLQAIQAP